MIELHRTDSWQQVLLGGLGALLLVAAVAVGCGDKESHPAPPNLDDGGSGGEGGGAGSAGVDGGAGGEDVLVGECSWGSERECKIYVGDPPGSEGCWVGMQYCIDHQWTECDTTVTPQATDGE